MFGTNQKLDIISKAQESFSVVNIFKTIQGEGIYAGKPAIFLRLGGCNLACKFCDTEFDDFSEQTSTEIIDKIKELSQGVISLVVITGGEPLRQNIATLCEAILANKYQIQIETNGTIKRKLPEEVEIICSPKQFNNQYNINEDLINFVDAFKIVLSTTGKYNKVPKINTSKSVFIQPMDEYDEVKNKANIEYAIEKCYEYNYILSLQQHKILGLD